VEADLFGEEESFGLAEAIEAAHELGRADVSRDDQMQRRPASHGQQYPRVSRA
jgi:hypothetical protein